MKFYDQKPKFFTNKLNYNKPFEKKENIFRKHFSFFPSKRKQTNISIEKIVIKSPSQRENRFTHM